jgi:hypothetical protein
MRNLLLVLCALICLFSCSKDKDPDTYTIRYQIIGTGVEEIKYNINDINYSVKKDFTNGWDTTFTHTSKQKLQLQAKAKTSTSNELTGIIYLNNQEVKKEIDNSKDGDGKFEVKLEYPIQ